MSKIKVDIDLSKSLPEIARNAGAGYVQDENGEIHKSWYKQWKAINAHCHSKTSKISDYVVYKMPLGVWVAAYVVIALFVVSLLS